MVEWCQIFVQHVPQDASYSLGPFTGNASSVWTVDCVPSLVWWLEWGDMADLPVVICQAGADSLELGHQILQLLAQCCSHACARLLIGVQQLGR